MTNHHDAIVTAGVDFASQASNTATCSITWTSAEAVITELTSSCDDNFILELVSRVTKVGIDVPLGWPSPFVEALRMHAHDGSWPANYEHVTNLKDYRLRSTDNWVHETLKLPLPLSVATDRIAIPTMRAAALFARNHSASSLGWFGSGHRGLPRRRTCALGLHVKGLQGHGER